MANHRVLSPPGWAAVLAGVAVPVAVAAAWIPVRASQPNVVVALALVVVITASGASRRRIAVAATAASAAAAFVFFDTAPYDRFQIARQPDFEVAVALVIVGVLTGELALRVTRQRGFDLRTAGDLARIRDASAGLAIGEELVTLIGAVAAHLREVLGASDCAYTVEALPAGMPVVSRDGSVEGPVVDELALPVLGLGTVLGHFVARVPPHQMWRREALSVAVTLTDQVGAALAAQAGLPRQAARSLADPVPRLRVLR